MCIRENIGNLCQNISVVGWLVGRSVFLGPIWDYFVAMNVRVAAGANIASKDCLQTSQTKQTETQIEFNLFLRIFTNLKVICNSATHRIENRLVKIVQVIEQNLFSLFIDFVCIPA